MEEYRAIFKCRLCGCIYMEGITGKNIAISSTLDACAGNHRIPQAPHMNEIHYCENGDIGIGDFQGFKRMNDKTI